MLYRNWYNVQRTCNRYSSALFANFNCISCNIPYVLKCRLAAFRVVPRAIGLVHRYTGYPAIKLCDRSGWKWSGWRVLLCSRSFAASILRKTNSTQLFMVSHISRYVLPCLSFVSEGKFYGFVCRKAHKIILFVCVLDIAKFIYEVDLTV
jgi:hypothetical protein